MTSASETVKTPVVLFTAGFRPFFLLAGLLGFIGMLLWLIVLNGGFIAPAVTDWVWWHAHEMTFGFSGAVLAGFLLTAIPGWSGLPALKGKPLALLAILWLLVRVSLLLLGELHIISFALDTLWWLGLTYVLAKPLVVKKLWSNMFFVPVLLGLTLLNGLSYLTASGFELYLAERVNSGSALLIILVMLTMGGRVFPIYTARTLKLEPIVANSTLDIAAAACSALFVVSWIVLDIGAVTVWPMALLAVAGGTLHLYRLSHWHSVKTLQVSLLWSLHGAYLFIALGFIGIAYALLFAPQYLMLMLHLCTVGGMGLIILSMLTRVTLGHNRKPLVAPKLMTVAFVLMLLALLARSILPLFAPQFSLGLYSVSALLWVGAFGMYLWRFIPLLVK